MLPTSAQNQLINSHLHWRLRPEALYRTDRCGNGRDDRGREKQIIENGVTSHWMTNHCVCLTTDKLDKYLKICNAHVTKPLAWLCHTPTSLVYNGLSDFTVKWADASYFCSSLFLFLHSVHFPMWVHVSCVILFMIVAAVYVLANVSTLSFCMSCINEIIPPSYVYNKHEARIQEAGSLVVHRKAESGETPSLAGNSTLSHFCTCET